MALSESKIQSRIITKLGKLGWESLKVIVGNRSGWPDISLFKDRVTFFIEVKKPGEKPSKLQLHVHSVLRKQGFGVYVIENIDQLEDITEIN